MFRWAGRLAFVLLFNVAASSGLMAAEWQVVKVSGTVWVVGFDIEPMRATAGMVLPPDATIATARNARAMLRHGEDILNLGPGTQLAPQSRAVRGLTTVLMRQGDAVLDIEHREKPHFAVETPFLAAVVKGTRFTVDVHGGDAGVSVQRGRVQVTSFAAHQSVDVTTGESVQSSRGGLELSGPGLQGVRTVAARSAVVESTDVATEDASVGRNDNNIDSTKTSDGSTSQASTGSNSESRSDSKSGPEVKGKGSDSAGKTGVRSNARGKKHASSRHEPGRKFFGNRHQRGEHFKRNRRHGH